MKAEKAVWGAIFNHPRHESLRGRDHTVNTQGNLRTGVQNCHIPSGRRPNPPASDSASSPSPSSVTNTTTERFFECSLRARRHKAMKPRERTQEAVASTSLAAPPQCPRPLLGSSVPHESRVRTSLRGSPSRCPCQGPEGFSHQDGRESLALETRRKHAGRRVHVGPLGVRLSAQLESREEATRCPARGLTNGRNVHLKAALKARAGAAPSSK